MNRLRSALPLMILFLHAQPGFSPNMHAQPTGKSSPSSQNGDLLAGIYAQAAGRYETAVSCYSAALKSIASDREKALMLGRRASAYNAMERFREGLRDAQKAIQLDSHLAPAYGIAGDSLFRLGRYPEAMKDLEQGLAANPSDALSLNNMAWFQATCPDPRYRDGHSALAKARKALELTKGKVGSVFDTVAAACAETNDFQSAVRYEDKALASTGLTMKEQQDYKKNLARFQRGQAIRETVAQ